MKCIERAERALRVSGTLLVRQTGNCIAAGDEEGEGGKGGRRAAERGKNERLERGRARSAGEGCGETRGSRSCVTRARARVSLAVHSDNVGVCRSK